MTLLRLRFIEAVQLGTNIVIRPFSKTFYQSRFNRIAQDVKNDSAKLSISNNVIVTLMLPEGSRPFEKDVTLSRCVALKRLQYFEKIQTIIKRYHHVNMVRHNRVSVKQIFASISIMQRFFNSIGNVGLLQPERTKAFIEIAVQFSESHAIVAVQGFSGTLFDNGARKCVRKTEGNEIGLVIGKKVRQIAPVKLFSFHKDFVVWVEMVFRLIS